jgi:hypothetical protein
MAELFPLGMGLLTGLGVGRFLRPSIAVYAWLPLAIGVAATVISGEFELSWGFLLVDVPLAAIAFAAGLALARYVHARTAQRT